MGVRSANIMAFVALFVAVAGGIAVGLPGRNSVDSGDIRRGAVREADLKRPKVVRVRANPRGSSDPCAAGTTKVLCGEEGGSGFTGWEAPGGDFAAPAFYRDGFGIVHLEGVVAFDPAPSPNIRKPVFLLPRRYRPTRNREFAVVYGQVSGSCAESTDPRCIAGRLVVGSSGEVESLAYDGFNSHNRGVSLDGISFRAR